MKRTLGKKPIGLSQRSIWPGRGQGESFSCSEWGPSPPDCRKYLDTSVGLSYTHTHLRLVHPLPHFLSLGHWRDVLVHSRDTHSGRREAGAPCSRGPKARWWHWAVGGTPPPSQSWGCGENGDSRGGQGPGRAWAAPGLSFPACDIKERVGLGGPKGSSKWRCPKPSMVSPDRMRARPAQPS